jgi:predicted aconitase with swiveling domain
MKTITGGRTIMPGIATGEALVTSQSMGFNFGVDGETGYVIEHGHELEGQSLQDKVLIFPSGKGSTGGSFVIYQIVRGGKGPVAMVNVACESIIALGAIMAGIPMIDSLSENPLEIVKTGDLVRIDGAAGTLEILRRAEEKEKST